MTCADSDRYSRQTRLDGFGLEGQKKLAGSSVLIVGAGGLGSPCSLYLAGAGVDTLGIVDGDAVSLSNLQRQIIHTTADVGRNKALSAADGVHRINPEIEVRTYGTFLTADNAAGIIAGYDFIIDCTDSPASKYIVNDACVLAGKPFCCGGVTGYGGQVMTHLPGTACYRCLFPDGPSGAEYNASAGVLGPAVGVMGSIQAAEAIKYLAGLGGLLTDSLIVYEVRTMEFRRIRFKRNESCPACGRIHERTKE